MYLNRNVLDITIKWLRHAADTDGLANDVFAEILDVFAKFLDDDGANFCFEMIDLVAAINSVQKSSISELSTNFQPFDVVA